jgi:hypothetical protein
VFAGSLTVETVAVGDGRVGTRFGVFVAFRVAGGFGVGVRVIVAVADGVLVCVAVMEGVMVNVEV